MKRMSKILVAITIVSSLLFNQFPINAQASTVEIVDRPFIDTSVTYDWEYSFTGAEQTFTAPYTGTYQFGLYGAQGGNSTNSDGETLFTGGYGGQLDVSLSLTKGDTVTINVGGQNGYNGGGTGIKSNGGGATSIKINGSLVAIAGGGGGGTTAKAGGAGGASDSGNNGTSINGSSSTASGTAGGGGGYNGGKVGRYATNVSSTVTHKWRITSVRLLGTESGPRVQGEGDSSWRNYTATLTPITTDLNTPSGTITWPYFFAGVRASATVYASWTAGTYSGSDFQWVGETPPSGTQVTKTVTSTSTVNSASKGGSNWYNSSCTLITDAGGQQAGDGYCGVSLLSANNLVLDDVVCSNIYYDDTQVLTIYYNNFLVYKGSSTLEGYDPSKSYITIITSGESVVN